MQQHYGANGFVPKTGIPVDGDEHIAMIVGPVLREIYGDTVEIGHYRIAIAVFKMAFDLGYEAGKLASAKV